MRESISRPFIAILLVIFSNTVAASEVAVTEPGPAGLLVLGGIAVLLAARIKKKK